ncbi:MAG: hypothetical protein QNK03_13375, partial [Myxococcota bacterium]|nr:hypothetical protein [Myxococcota bacterium]
GVEPGVETGLELPGGAPRAPCGAPAPATRGAPELDAELARLAAGGAPLRRALARLAGSLVARRDWQALGFVRADDYARERLGLSGRELHDLARTDAALAGPPLVVHRETSI